MGGRSPKQPVRKTGDGIKPGIRTIGRTGRWLKYSAAAMGGTLAAALFLYMAGNWAWLLGGTAAGTALLYLFLSKDADARAVFSRNKMIGKLGDSLPIMVYQCRAYPNGRCVLTYSNAAIRWICELDYRDVKKDCSPILDLVHPEDRERIEKSLWESALHLTPWVGDYRVVLPKQGVRWRFAHARVERLPDGSTLWNGFIMDNTAKKEAEERLRMVEQWEAATLRATHHAEQKKLELLTTLNEKLHREATHDHLTGAYLRRYFERKYAEMFEQVRQGNPLTVILCDIDFFKDYNDTLGHLAGDHALNAVARTLSEQINRKDQILARYGGEEFVAVLPGLGSDRAGEVGEQMRQSVEALALRTEPNGDTVVTISVGVACLDSIPENMTAEKLLKAADDALYAAKHSGRNCVRVQLLDAVREVRKFDGDGLRAERES